MPSLIAWLDSTAEEQRAARELIAMFSDKESRDELGIGPIRDAFSDLLFPGTSVLQTRARYYLFVPWCYLTPDVTRLQGRAHRDRGRGNERALIKALSASGASNLTGMIGARSGVNVRNLPSDIYWNGMIRYRVREHRGGIGSLALPTANSDGATELTDRRLTEWSRTIPPVPVDFPNRVEDGFTLTREEADWLKERILATTEGTVLAHLLEQDESIPTESKEPWFAAPESQFEELHHAKMFSTAMEGAALLYNLLIAARYEQAGLAQDDLDRVGEYEERLGDWQESLSHPAAVAEWSRWDVDRMWEIVRQANANIQPRTREFVNRWISGVGSARGLATDESLRGLVAEREKRKGAQSRLKNEKMLAAWSGASGTGRMTYRWGTVKVIVNDIVRGLSLASP
jgi:hypothetical protein